MVIRNRPRITYSTGESFGVQIVPMTGLAFGEPCGLGTVPLTGLARSITLVRIFSQCNVWLGARARSGALGLDQRLVCER